MDQDIQCLSQAIGDIQRDVESLKARPSLKDHFHSGLDVSNIKWQDINLRKFHIWHTIQGVNAATGTFYGVFWIAPFACYLSGFKEVHQTAGTDGGTVSLTLEKLTGTQALDAGSVMLNSALSLKAAENTVQTGVLTGTIANLNLSVGDRIAMKGAGTLTAVANITVDLEITII